jgi:hypothetical protein
MKAKVRNLERRVRLAEARLEEKRHPVERPRWMYADKGLMLYGKLEATMWESHRLQVNAEMMRLYDYKRICEFLAPGRTGTTRRIPVPRLRLSKLTLNFLERYERALRGDSRPLALPYEAGRIYADADADRHKVSILHHAECPACGYDTPILVPSDYRHGASRPDACPLCGSALAGGGPKIWAGKNPDKVVVDVYVWPDGEVSVIK